jgi:hypothetical protein
MKTLQEIEKEVAKLARRVGASLHDLPTYGVSRDGGYPHIEAKDGLYHYVVVERGEERERRSSADFDDLVYWIFRSVTHNMAFFPEDMARIRDQDCRRVAFPKQIQLMKRLGPKMGERMEQDIADILRIAPYGDEPARALNRMQKTRGG